MPVHSKEVDEELAKKTPISPSRQDFSGPGEDVFGRVAALQQEFREAARALEKKAGSSPRRRFCFFPMDFSRSISTLKGDASAYRFADYVLEQARGAMPFKTPDARLQVVGSLSLVRDIFSRRASIFGTAGRRIGGAAHKMDRLIRQLSAPFPA